MNTDQDLAEMAKQVQAAYDVDGETGQRFLQELFADKLEIRHTPPGSFDGIVDRSFLVSYQNDGWAKRRDSMREWKLDGAVTIEDGRLVVTKTFSGITPDGREIGAVSRAEYHVENGKIVGADSTGTVVEKAFTEVEP